MLSSALSADAHLSLVASQITTSKGLNIDVDVSGDVATVVFTGATLTTADFNTLLNGLTYQHVGNNPSDGERVIGVTSVTDSGSDNSAFLIANENTAQFVGPESRVDVLAVNDPAVISGDFSASGDETDSALQFTGS